MPLTTWAVVANQTSARLFIVGRGRAIEEIEDAFNPRGRASDRDIDADRPGRVFDSMGSGRHAMSREHSPHEQAAEDFARAIAERLSAARTANDLDALVVIAEPRFLGRLRDAFDAHIAALVIATLDKDLVKLDHDALADTIDGLLRSGPSG
jgi:protein required for attachment to host cells